MKCLFFESDRGNSGQRTVFFTMTGHTRSSLLFCNIQTPFCSIFYIQDLKVFFKNNFFLYYIYSIYVYIIQCDTACWLN